MIGTTKVEFKVQVNEVHRTFSDLQEGERWIELCRDVPNPNEIFGDSGSNIIYDNIEPIIDGVLRGESTLCMFRGKYVTIFVDRHSVNGILLIVPTKAYQEWQSNFATMDTGVIDFVAMEENFADAFEDIWTNSQLKYQYDHEWSPIFEYEGPENVWCYNNYTIEAFTESIYKDGFALFTKFNEPVLSYQVMRPRKLLIF